MATMACALLALTAYAACNDDRTIEHYGKVPDIEGHPDCQPKTLNGPCTTNQCTYIDYGGIWKCNPNSGDPDNPTGQACQTGPESRIIKVYRGDCAESNGCYCSDAQLINDNAGSLVVTNTTLTACP